MSDAVDRAVKIMFEAAIGQRDWASGLDAVAAAFGAAGAAIVSFDAAEMPIAPVSGELKDVMASFVEGGWHLRDLRGQRAWPIAQSGQSVILEHELSTAEERATLPYYQDFFVPVGMPWFAATTVLVDEKPWSLSLLRGTKQGPYEQSHVPLLEQIQRPLADIIKLAMQIRRSNLDSQQQVASLLGSTVLALDRDGVILVGGEMSAFALEPELSVNGRRLVATLRDDNLRLQALIAEALQARNTLRGVPLGMLLKSGTQGRLFLDIVSSPDRSIFSDAALWIILRRTDPERASLKAEKVQFVLGLSPGEARVAVQIASGYSPKETAHRLGSSYETVRTQLASVFRKLSISRQSELSVLIANLTA